MPSEWATGVFFGNVGLRLELCVISEISGLDE